MNTLQTSSDIPRPSDVTPSLDLPQAVTDTNFSMESLANDFFEGFVEGIEEFFEGLGELFGITDASDTTRPSTEGRETPREVTDTREFGVKECAEAASDIFTPQVLNEWGMMSYEARLEKLNEYAAKVAEVLGVNVNVVFQEGLLQQGAWGYNDGQGNVVLDTSFVTDPAQVLEAISTIAHETRHQFQHDVVNHPENYDIDAFTVAEWKAGFENYTQQMQTAEDPWGYFFNPVEIDARYFGESVVRELTRGIINH